MKYTLLVMVLLFSPAYGVEITQDELKHLNTLALNFDNTGSKIVINPIEGSSCEVNAAQAVLVFKKHGVKEIESLFKQFSINDYKERDQNIYNIWDRKEISALTKKYRNGASKYI